MILHELTAGGRHWQCGPASPVQHPIAILRDEAERRYFADSGGAPEAPLILWAKQFLDPSKVFVDVGAHVGTWTLTLAKHCKYVHAFEPQRSTFYRLCGGIALSGLTNVSAHELALANFRSRTHGLHIVSEDGGGSSLQDFHRQRVLREELVQVGIMDDLAILNIGLIKLDVEGAELDVLKGATKTLERNGFPTLLVECWQAEWFREKAKELRTWAKLARYKVTPIAGWPEMLLLEGRRS